MPLPAAAQTVLRRLHLQLFQLLLSYFRLLSSMQPELSMIFLCFRYPAKPLLLHLLLLYLYDLHLSVSDLYSHFVQLYPIHQLCPESVIPQLLHDPGSGFRTQRSLSVQTRLQPLQLLFS